MIDSGLLGDCWGIITPPESMRSDSLRAGVRVRLRSRTPGGPPLRPPIRPDGNASEAPDAASIAPVFRIAAAQQHNQPRKGVT